MSLRDSISKTKRLSQGKLMRALSNCLGGGAWMNLNSTKYFKRRDGIGILRIANHYGNANEFASRKEMNGNYGIVFRMEKRGKYFRKDSRVQYKEEVYFANIDAATEIQIINGLIDWIQNGNFTCPSGILTNESP